MPYDEKLADRVREAIADAGEIEEKKMFRGMCFMVNGKMCICISGEELMCRIGSEAYDKAIEMPGVRPMVMKGKTLKDYVYVSGASVQSKKELSYWVKRCLAFNKDAKASKRKKPKQ